MFDVSVPSLRYWSFKKFIFNVSYSKMLRCILIALVDSQPALFLWLAIDLNQFFPPTPARLCYRWPISTARRWLGALWSILPKAEWTRGVLGTHGVLGIRRRYLSPYLFHSPSLRSVILFQLRKRESWKQERCNSAGRRFLWASGTSCAWKLS